MRFHSQICTIRDIQEGSGMDLLLALLEIAIGLYLANNKLVQNNLEDKAFDQRNSYTFSYSRNAHTDSQSSV